MGYWRSRIVSLKNNFICSTPRYLRYRSFLFSYVQECTWKSEVLPSHHLWAHNAPYDHWVTIIVYGSILCYFFILCFYQQAPSCLLEQDLANNINLNFYHQPWLFCLHRVYLTPHQIPCISCFFPPMVYLLHHH